ncbi:cytochrome P450 [soil metagenome]
MLPTIAELSGDPHPHHARLRGRSAVAWVPELDAFLVTGWSAAMDVLRDSVTFTVDDPRFSTAQVVGPSMLSLDGDEHARHRDPFAGPFRPRHVSERFSAAVGAEVARLIDALATGGPTAELRSDLAGPLAGAVVANSLGLDRSIGPGATAGDDDHHGPVEIAQLLEWYGAIVASVSVASTGCPVTNAGAVAFRELAAALRLRLRSDQVEVDSTLVDAVRHGGLTTDEVTSNAAVIMFGGIETTEAMLLNALWFLLRSPEALAAVRADPSLVDAAVEESLRLEPAATVVDRYATRDVELAGTEIAAGAQVTVSLAAANRDPAEFADPDRYVLDRPRRRRHLAFAAGPHIFIGMDLARLEVVTAVTALLARFPALRLSPEAPPPTGLIFRKPPRLPVALTS